MQCMVCKQNTAKVHFTQIVGDKMQRVDLCEDCAKAKGVNDAGNFSFADLLLGISGEKDAAALPTATAPAADADQLKCPTCGFSQADFKKNGRLGCPECYSTFAESLEGLLKTMHKGTRHIGKMPVALRLKTDSSERLKTLQKRLEKAVQQEDFELAANLRDEIRQIAPRSSTAAAS
jgi:protein arginine kinase activator